MYNETVSDPTGKMIQRNWSKDYAEKSGNAKALGHEVGTLTIMVAMIFKNDTKRLLANGQANILRFPSAGPASVAGGVYLDRLNCCTQATNVN